MKIRCAYCGKKHNVPTFSLKLLSIFTDKYYFLCQYCMHYNAYLLRFQVTHNSIDKKEKEANKKLEKSRR